LARYGVSNADLVNAVFAARSTNSSTDQEREAPRDALGEERGTATT
jgi:hypothetical protein